MPTADARSRPAAHGPRRLVVLVLLALAAAQLAVADLDPSAPARQGFGPNAPAARQSAWLANLTAPVVRLADGRNVELHFAAAPNLPAAADGIAEGVYYGLNYALFPARAFVGDDRQVVNNGATLRRADRVPPDAWLRGHGVAAVVVYPLDAQGLHRPTALPVR